MYTRVSKKSHHTTGLDFTRSTRFSCYNKLSGRDTNLHRVITLSNRTDCLFFKFCFHVFIYYKLTHTFLIVKWKNVFKGSLQKMKRNNKRVTGLFRLLSPRLLLFQLAASVPLVIFLAPAFSSETRFGFVFRRRSANLAGAREQMHDPPYESAFRLLYLYIRLRKREPKRGRTLARTKKRIKKLPSPLKKNTRRRNTFGSPWGYAGAPRPRSNMDIKWYYARVLPLDKCTSNTVDKVCAIYYQSEYGGCQVPSPTRVCSIAQKKKKVWKKIETFPACLG